MPDGPSAALTFYPAYCWSSSPTYNTWVKLSAADVHALKQRPGYEGQRLYFHLNHPIRYIRLVGLITSFEPATTSTTLSGPDKRTQTTKTPWTFTLDDGSGSCITVICWRDDPEVHYAKQPGELCKPTYADMHRRPGRTVSGKDVHLDEVELGRVVKVKGWVDEFRGMRQVLLERVEVVRDTAAEVVEWMELAKWQKEVLGVPWVLEEEEVRRLRERDERRRRRLAGGGKRKREGDGGKGNEEVGGRAKVVRDAAWKHAEKAVAVEETTEPTGGEAEAFQPRHRTRVVPTKADADAERPLAAVEHPTQAGSAPEVFQPRHRTREVPTKKTGDDASRPSTTMERPRPQANTKAARKHQGS